MWQNHQLPSVQSYSLPAVMPVPSSSLFLPPLPHLVIHRNIIRRFCLSAPFSEKRNLHLFVRFIHVTLSRASGRFTFIYTNVYGGGIFQPIFRLAPLVILFLFFFFLFFYSHSPLQKRVLYGLSKRLIDIVAYHAIIFFSITAKRLLLRRQNVVANIFMQRKIVYFQRYAPPPPKSFE